MASTQASERGDTRAAVLDIAEGLLQRRGFNGFSYADISSELGVTNAALHYYFPGKAELGHALITRYADRFVTSLSAIEDSEPTAPGRLRAYVVLYRTVLERGRMCLCGMLAAEYHTLPEPMRESVMGFFDRNHDWLTRVLEQGRADDTIRLAGHPRATAEMVVGALEGAMLVARTYGETTRFDAVAEQLLAQLCGP
ncbi:MAG TPA: TetR/AcrR family transcriptional regulator [Acidimicrobiales bacterium]